MKRLGLFLAYVLAIVLVVAAQLPVRFAEAAGNVHTGGPVAVFEGPYQRVTCNNSPANPKSTALAQGIWVLTTSSNAPVFVREGLVANVANLDFAAVGSGATVVLNVPVRVYIDGAGQTADTVFCSAGVATTLWISRDTVK